ncbi:MAG: biotin--[acetyl-CoA-carboxylase] ligase [Planctomycetota bacterium]
MFDIDLIRALRRVAVLDHHRELGSTSDRAKQLAADPAQALPTLVLCDRQTAGRGRGSNRWSSAEGGLTFSLLIDPGTYGLSGNRLPALSLTTALAVCEAAEQVAGARLQIKWPNDVVNTQRRKAAGILLESPLPGRMVIGVGVNVNATPGEPGEALADTVTSVAATAGVHTVDPTQLLLAILERLDKNANGLGADDPTVHERWSQRDALRGRFLTLETTAGPVTGHAEGFAPNGALRLSDGAIVSEHLSGSVRAIH